jgi:hypothetical protein
MEEFVEYLRKHLGVVAVAALTVVILLPFLL